MGIVFTIYKISFYKLCQELQELGVHLVNEKDITYYNTKYDTFSKERQQESNKLLITKYITELKKDLDIVRDINSNSYKGFYYRSESIPTWNKLIDNLIGESVTESNVNHSYILFIFIDNIIFAVCGNSGSGKIKKIIETNFGLSLIPKILGGNEPVIRDLTEKVPRGVSSSNTRSNRFKTAVISEIDYEKFLKSMTLETTSVIVKELGFDDVDETNITKILARDAIQIYRKISYKFLLSMLENITNIMKREDAFSLGYLAAAIKINKNYSKDKLDDELHEQLLTGKFEVLELSSDSFSEVSTQILKFQLHDENEKCVLEKSVLFNSSEIFGSIDKLSKNKIKKIINKYTIVGMNSSDEILERYSIKYMADALIEYDDRCFYLINNEWYTSQDTYTKFLDEKFENIIKTKKKRSDAIIEYFDLLNKDNKNEADYNQSIGYEKSIIVDRKLISRVELADVILWDDDNLYLLHNKKEFNGIGSRDLSSQILSSAKILYYRKNDSVLKSYYKRIGTTKIDEKTFINLFTRKTIYLAGYLTNFKLDSKSTYAKLLTNLTNNNLETYNYEFYPLNLEI